MHRVPSILLVSTNERQIPVNDNIGRVKLTGLSGRPPVLYASPTGQFSASLMALRGANNEIQNRAITLALIPYSDFHVGCRVFVSHP